MVMHFRKIYSGNKIQNKFSTKTNQYEIEEFDRLEDELH
jgi:hypothetical protein